MELKKEIQVESEKIFDGRIIEVFKDKVLCPNGRTSTREIVRHKGATCVVAVNGDKIIMEKQFRYPYDEVLIEVPAGKLEPGEDAIEGARRELEEETGYYANKMTYLGLFYPTVAYSDEKIHIFLAESLKKTQTNWDVDENIEIYEETLENLLKQIDEGLIKDGKTIAAIFKYVIHKKIEM